MKKFLLFLLGLAFFHFSAICQNKAMHEKIDPILLRLMDEQRQLDSSTGITRLKCGDKKATGKNFSRKTFDCIIYTENAKAIQDSGITVNSVFPTFVTAMANAAQIEQLSKMPSVRYISASGRNEKDPN